MKLCKVRPKEIGICIPDSYTATTLASALRMQRVMNCGLYSTLEWMVTAPRQQTLRVNEGRKWAYNYEETSPPSRPPRGEIEVKLPEGDSCAPSSSGRFLHA